MNERALALRGLGLAQLTRPACTCKGYPTSAGGSARSHQSSVALLTALDSHARIICLPFMLVSSEIRESYLENKESCRSGCDLGQIISLLMRCAKNKLLCLLKSEGPTSAIFCAPHDLVHSSGRLSSPPAAMRSTMHSASHFCPVPLAPFKESATARMNREWSPWQTWW